MDDRAETACGRPRRAPRADAPAARSCSCAASLLALAVPFVAKNFLVFQLTLVMVYAIAILGLNLLTGFNGQFSLGHGAFYAHRRLHGRDPDGARADVAYVWTLPAAGAVCFVAGFLFGLPALRLEGIYLALATFALAVAMPQILKFSPLEHWTGGVQGIVILKPDAPFGLPLNPDQWLYFFTLGGRAGRCSARRATSCTAAPAAPSWRSATTRSRRAAMGINIALYKTADLRRQRALHRRRRRARRDRGRSSSRPDSFTFSLSIALLVGLVVGGVGSIPGALFGGALRAVRAEHRRARLERAVGRALRRDPDPADLLDAVGRRRASCSFVAEPRREAWRRRPEGRKRHEELIVHRSASLSPPRPSRRPRRLRPGRRAEEIRSRRERHRDQDRQHQPLQRPGLGLRPDRQDHRAPTSRRSTPRAASTAARSTSSPTTTATARRRRSSRRASWSRATRCC